jgi:hypothetical protein
MTGCFSEHFEDVGAFAKLKFRWEEKEWTYRYEITEKKNLHNNSLKVQPFCHEFWQLLFILACSFLWRRMSSVYLEDGYVWGVVRIIWKLQGPCSSCLFQPNIKRTLMWMLVRELMRGFDCHWGMPTSWVHPLFVIYGSYTFSRKNMNVRVRERERERFTCVSKACQTSSVKLCMWFVRDPM